MTGVLRSEYYDSDRAAMRVTTVPSGLDAFGRIRTAETGQRLDVEFLYHKQTTFFDEVTNSGTVTHNSATRDLTLSISNATSGTYALMRSHPVPYTPGNSQLIEMTGVLDLAGLGSGTAQIFVRTSTSGSAAETVYDQSAWDNVLTGIDWTKSHIFAIDFQSLKVGLIRFGLNQSGLSVPVLAVANDNVRAMGYWQLASLPVYWRIYNDATYTYMELGYGDEANAVGFRYRVAANASATMKAICCTVKSESGLSLRDIDGVPFCAHNGVTEKTVSTTLIPLLSVRALSTFNSLPNLSLLLPKSFTVQTDQPVRLDVVVDGTLTGASWTSVNSGVSAAEYDVTASAISGGRTVFSGFYTGASANKESSGTGLLGKSVLWSRLSSQSGIITLAAIKTASTDASMLASLMWEEIQ